MKYVDLSGAWSVSLQNGHAGEAVLPGTLDENRIGGRDSGSRWRNSDTDSGKDPEPEGDARILTRLTRKYTYEGPAWFTKTISMEETGGQRVFLEVERSRELTLALNGKDIIPCRQGTVSTPYVFEVTSEVKEGENVCTLCCDNSYPSWPRDAIVNSSAATDETQTNWNGLLGYLRLRFEKSNFISSIRVYPDGKIADVIVELDCTNAYTGLLSLRSKAFAHELVRKIAVPAGRNSIRIGGIPLSESVSVWEDGNGILYSLAVSADGMEEKAVDFGIRTFADQNGRLALNSRVILLRGEANCCVFPETGHMPMTSAEWKTVLTTYQSYGVNCIRFHSHCPPDAAFTAADEIGMMMQPELSHWDPKTAFESEKSWGYYQLELRQILFTYANHPSFVMLTFGNELCAGALGHKRMDLLQKTAEGMDPTRLYAIASNCHYGSIGPDRNSNFYTSSGFYAKLLRGTSSPMRGFINQQYPNAKTNYGREMKQLRQEYSRPVFSFEVGQYEVLPDFDELQLFHGVTRPDNYFSVREKAERQGWLPDWRKRVEASGELSLLAYREEVEAVMRTEELSGISLLSLQDFPGQGTALVGMLNSHMQPKPFSFADPKRFRKFFADVLPLILLDRYTYLNTETITAEVRIANYGRREISGTCRIRWRDGDKIIKEQVLPSQVYPCGSLSVVGAISFPAECIPNAGKLTVTASVGGSTNSYPVWIYPDKPFSCPDSVFMTQSPGEAAAALEEGKSVFLNPPVTPDNFPHSIPAQFTTDFWSVETFGAQSGFMGCFMDPQHPVFNGFPTEFHSNWQWWPMCRGRAMLLPKSVDPLITALDCCTRMRRMGMLIECRVGKGKLILSSMGLMESARYPEVRALMQSIVNYMAGDHFHPLQEISRQTLNEISPAVS